MSNFIMHESLGCFEGLILFSRNCEMHWRPGFDTVGTHSYSPHGSGSCFYEVLQDVDGISLEHRQTCIRIIFEYSILHPVCHGSPRGRRRVRIVSRVGKSDSSPFHVVQSEPSTDHPARVHPSSPLSAPVAGPPSGHWL